LKCSKIAKPKRRRRKKQVKKIREKIESTFNYNEASNIWDTRESEMWRWRRLKEWYQNIEKEDDITIEQKEILRNYGIKI